MSGGFAPMGGGPGGPGGYPQQGGPGYPQQQPGYPGYPQPGGAPGYGQPTPGYPGGAPGGPGYPSQSPYPPPQGGPGYPQAAPGYQGGPGYPQPAQGYPGQGAGPGYPGQGYQGGPGYPQPAQGAYPQPGQQGAPGYPGYPQPNQVYPQAGPQPTAAYQGVAPGYPQAGPQSGYPQAGPQSAPGYPDSRPMTQPTFSTTGSATSTVELSVSCKKLIDKDVLSKSDPMCVLYMKVGNGGYVEVGRTEIIKDNLNPAWRQKFLLDYRFEERQFLKFEVYDSDSKSAKLKDHDFLGRMECTLGAVVSSPGRQFISIIKDGPSKGGQFIITAEEVSGSKDSVRIQLAAKSLENKDTFGKSDPFFVLSKMSGHGQFSVVHRSEVVKNNLNPVWREINISMRELCNGDRQRQLKVEIYDYDDSGNNDFIGSFVTTANELESCASNQRPISVINSTKQSKKKNYKNSGEVYVKAFRTESATSFMDYIQGGTALNFSVAVDFTASNGDPRDSRSLHFRHSETAENQYTTAIRAVGSIVEDYDADKMFPALGFGGKVPPRGDVSHEFFLNLRDNPYCAGTEGIIQAYLTALNQVTLYGPTNFSPVINHVARFASAAQDGKQYFVLLIITDGIITDLDETKRALVNASSLPMSVIVVGVGNEDFSAMVALDSDNGMLRDSTGRTAARDIVQFVELRRFVTPGSNTWSKELLAQQVLAEIPKQLVGWMSMRGIKPLKY